MLQPLKCSWDDKFLKQLHVPNYLKRSGKESSRTELLLSKQDTFFLIKMFFSFVYKKTAKPKCAEFNSYK